MPADLTPAGLLSESWASNETRGFFIGAGPAGSSVSLYDTAWWPRAMGRMPARLLPASVGPWLLPLLYGAPGSAGLADTQTLPELAVLEDGVLLASELHIPINGAKIADRVGSLLDGTLYKSAANERSGDWGSTVIAMSILSSLHAEPPTAVTSRAQAELPAALTTRQDSQLSTIASVLSMMNAQEVKDNRVQLRAQLGWMETLLPKMTSLARLALSSELRPAIERAGLPAWPPSSVCSGLRMAAGGVMPTPSAYVDPQATAQAVELGCEGTVVPPPWTAAGWPTDAALSNGIMDSVDGLRIAQFLGSSAQYASQLRTQLSQVWLAEPSAGGFSGDIAGLIELSPLLGVQSPKSALAALNVPGAVATQGGGGLPELLSAWLLGAKDSGSHASDAQISAQGNIFTAAADNLKFLVTADNRYRMAARKIVSDLSAGHDLYAATVSPSGVHPSAAATAIADWILHEQVPAQALRTAGLCNSMMSCGVLGVNSPIDEPLRATAAVMITSRIDNESFPIGI